MQTHIVKDGAVANTIVATIEEAQSAFPDAVCIDGSEGGIGWAWDGVQLTPPPAPQMTPEELIRQVKALRDTKTSTGGYLAGGKWFHSDLVSRTQQIGLILMGANIPAGLQWKTMDGSFVTMTPTLAGQVLAAAGAQDAALFAHAEVLIGQINAAADPTTVDVSAGWPATFGAA